MVLNPSERDLEDQPPHVEPAAVCVNHSPGCRGCSIMASTQCAGSRTRDARSERLHHPNALDARARRRRGLTPETSTEHVKVGWVNGRQTNAHKNLSSPRHRIRQIANTENVCRFAVALKDEGFHGALLSIRPDIPTCRPGRR